MTILGSIGITSVALLAIGGWFGEVTIKEHKIESPLQRALILPLIFVAFGLVIQGLGSLVLFLLY